MIIGAFLYNGARPVANLSWRHAEDFVSGLHAIRAQTRRHEHLPLLVTHDDVSTFLHRLEVGVITGQQSVRGRGVSIAVMYETLWTGLSRGSWEREKYLWPPGKYLLQ